MAPIFLNPLWVSNANVKSNLGDSKVHTGGGAAPEYTSLISNPILTGKPHFRKSQQLGQQLLNLKWEILSNF